MSRGKRETVGNGWTIKNHPFKEEAPGKHQGKKHRGKRIALIALSYAAAAVLIVVGVWKALVVPPDVSGNDRPGVTGGQTDNNLQEGETPLGDQQSGEEIGRKQDYYTFVLLGKDTGGGSNTDTILLVSYDVTNQVINALTIPRDTMINVSWNIKKINAVYASSRGVEGLKEEIGYLTGVVPDFYIAVEWEAIGKIVNALDGVWFDVSYHMDYDDAYQDLHIHQEKGYRLLNGEDAMEVIRWRSNNNDSPYGYHKEDGGIGDTGRQQVQKEFLKAVAKQCLQIGNWTKVSEFANIFFENIETDIPLRNLLWFAEKAMGLNMENITFHTLPGNDQGWYYTPSVRDNLAYFFAYPEEIVPLVNAHFNPYLRDITEDDLQIMYKNKDASLGVSNGVLADPNMAIPSVRPKNTASDASGDDDTSDLPETKEETSEAETPVDGTDPQQPTDGAQVDGENAADQESTADVEEPQLPEESSGGGVDAGDQVTENDDTQPPGWL